MGGRHSFHLRRGAGSGSEKRKEYWAVPMVGDGKKCVGRRRASKLREAVGHPASQARRRALS